MSKKFHLKLPLYIGTIFIFLLSWYLFSLKLNKPFFPSPIPVLKNFLQLLINGSLLIHILSSSFRVLSSIFISLILAVPIGLFLGHSPKLDKIIFPFIYLIYPIPKIAFLPIIIVIFGLGNLPKILLLTLIAFFQVLIATRDAAKSIPTPYLFLMKSLHASHWQTYYHLVFPSCLPKIFTAIRINLGTALAVLFFAETFASDTGIGFFILDMMEKREFVNMYAGIVGIGLLGLILYSLIDFLEYTFCPWNYIIKHGLL